jgi:glyoxylase-like metal-dependent hydrolase (beta-lactamase superfamily II)
MLPMRLGHLEVSRVVDLETPTSPRFLFDEMTREAMTPHIPWAAPHFYDPAAHRLLLSIQTFVLRTRHHTILVDTCLGNDKPRAYEGWNLRKGAYLDDLRKAGVAPEKVDFVLCTHLHVDHVGWNTRLDNGRWVPTFPNARYLFAKKEVDFWRATEMAENAQVFRDSVQPVLDAGLSESVAMDHALTDEVRLEPTPGHTPGHVSVHLTSRGAEGVITGDMMHHPVQIAEPGWSSKFDTDPKQSARTRREFCARYADRDVWILGTHFAPPTALHIVSERGRWLPRI